MDEVDEKTKDPREVSRQAGPLPERVVFADDWDPREYFEQVKARMLASRGKTLQNLFEKRAGECRDCPAALAQGKSPPCHAGPFAGQIASPLDPPDPAGGEKFEVQDCAKYADWLSIRTVRDMGLTPGYESARFGGFIAATDSQKKALRAMQRLVETGEFELRPGIRLYGEGMGCGKTYLAAAAARALLAKGRHVRFWYVPALLNALRGSFGQPGRFEALLREVTGAEVLVLDDLGTEKTTDWQVEQIAGILNGRRGAGMVTIVTTNFDIPGLEKKLSEIANGDPDRARLAARRVCSRLSELCAAVVVDGPDMRIVSGAKAP